MTAAPLSSNCYATDHAANVETNVCAIQHTTELLRKLFIINLKKVANVGIEPGDYYPRNLIHNVKTNHESESDQVRQFIEVVIHRIQALVVFLVSTSSRVLVLSALRSATLRDLQCTPGTFCWYQRKQFLITLFNTKFTEEAEHFLKLISRVFSSASGGHSSFDTSSVPQALYL